MIQWLQHSSDDSKTLGSILDSVDKNFNFLMTIMSIIYINIKAMLLFLMRKKKSTISSYNYIPMKTI